MDPFSEIIGLLKPRAAVAKPITGRGDWAVRYAAYGQPGFAIVLEGACHLEVEGEKPVRLERGDFVLLPAAPAFQMMSRPGLVPVPVEPVMTGVRHGEAMGEPDFRMLGGAFRIEPVNAPLLTGLLPRLFHLRATDGDTGRVGRLIDLAVEECTADRPGGDMVVARLLEVILLECLRWPFSDQAPGYSTSSGLLAGLADPALAVALRALHDDVAAGWTVVAMARLAGMSRSAFSARFSGIIGCAPMEYLARWRMVLARDALARGTTSLDRLAAEIGYESASAFSTAFRRHVGCAPGQFARRALAAG